MSKEQWGHGYHQGVKDALVGTLDHSFNVKRWSEVLVAYMMLNNRYGMYDRSLYSVHQALIVCNASFGMTKEQFEIVYSYILKNEPFGCYVSGDVENKDIYKDYFCLNPYLYTEEKLKCIIKGVSDET